MVITSPPASSVWAALQNTPNNRNLFLTFPPAEKDKITAPTDSASMRATHFLVLSCCVLMWWEEQGSSQISFKRALMALVRALTSRSNHLPKAHILIPLPWGPFSTLAFWRHKIIETVASACLFNRDNLHTRSLSSPSRRLKAGIRSDLFSAAVPSQQTVLVSSVSEPGALDQHHPPGSEDQIQINTGPPERNQFGSDPESRLIN